MKIIIIGAGQVGGTLAENLVIEGNDITVVDSNLERLNYLQSQLDIRTVYGPGSYPNILKKAGADSADMVIAVSSNDETNIVACQVAYTIFHTPTKIARIRSRHYQTHSELFDNAAIPIDVWISPELIVTTTMKQLIDNPGSLQVLNFAEGKVRLISLHATSAGILIGKSLSMLTEIIPNIPVRIAAIFRNKQSIPLSGETVIERDDEVFFIALTEHVRKIMDALGCKEEPYKRIMIAGGGNIGASLAKAIEDQYNVKLIEHNLQRTQLLAEELNNSTVLLGDASDRELLITENIEHIDVFCAVTNRDETNIMSSMQARRLGVRNTLTLVTRTAYAELLEGGRDIDIVISPQQITIGSILKHVRRGDIVNVYSLRRGAAEAIEIVAHGDESASKVVGRAVTDITLPSGANIGAIVRKGKILMPSKDVIIETEDHIIIFLSVKKHLRQVERLFQVSATFL